MRHRVIPLTIPPGSIHILILMTLVGSGMASDDVFVSYAWKEEIQRRVVGKLEVACLKQGIKLQRDRNEIDYGKSIRDYMDRLATGCHVVLILSETYFKSDYCMYELREIYNNKNFHNRVHPIVLRDTQFREPIARIPYLKYWEEKKAELVKQLGYVDRAYTKNLNASVDDYAEFRRLMDELLAVLADMNALTEDIHVNSDFEALINRLKPAGKGLQPGRNREPDAQFKSLIVRRVAEAINQCKPLHDALRVAMGDRANDEGMARVLCTGDFVTTVGEWLRPATVNCLRGLDSGRSEYSAIWAAAKTILVWLSPLAVREELITEIEQGQRAGDGQSFEIAVNTKFGVEVASSRYQQMEPRFRTEKGTAGVSGDQAIEEPGFETGWNDDFALETLLLAVWKQIFPAEARLKLSLGDIQTLNFTFKHREKHKTDHHYVPVSLDQQTALSRPDFYQKLMAKLPDLTVIYFNSSNTGPTLSITHEIEFMTIVREFLTIPEQLDRRQ